MTSFYNPYMKTPDWGQGASDLVNQLMMMMMMKKMKDPQTKTTETTDVGPQGMPPPMSNIPPAPGMGQQITGGAPTSIPTGGPPQMDPQMIQMLLQMLMRGGQPGMGQPMGR